MNVHPLVVHFPIALLTLYSLLEIASLFWRARTKKLEQTKIFLLLVGTVGTFFALQSGEMAEERLGIKKSDLVHTHEEFAEKTYITYFILSIYYLLVWARSKGLQSKLPSKAQTLLNRILDRPYLKYLVILWAALGLAFLTITWALGWAITHGPDIDPVVQVIHDLFVGN